jgi:PAS domain S-box-containing protein
MVLGIAAFRSIIPGYQTMAFSTAVLLIGIGAFLVTGAIRSFGRNTRLVVQAAMVLIIVIEAIEFPLNIWGSHGIFESLMVGIGNAIAGTPTSPISPATIILVILTSFGCILLTAPREPSGKSRSRDGAGLLGLVVALVSFTIILSYLYGVPIMYGSGLIPAAASTAIAFLALGSGLITAAGPGAVPLAYFSGDSIRAHLLRTFLPLTIVTILVGGGLEITRRIFGGTFDAILTAASIVVFSLIVGFVVFRASDRVGSALEAAERERQKAEDDLRVKNTELEAAYEKLTATDEELQQNYDELAKSQETLLKSEARLRLSSAYNRSLIEASLDPLVTISPDGTISDVNSATVNITGFSRGELIGTDFSRYFTEPDKAKAGYETVFREGIVKDYALEIQHVDGRVTPVLYNASVYRDEQGRAIGAFAAARDITVQKRAESALQNAHDELEERVEQRTAELEQRNEELGVLNEELTATQEELHQNLDELTLSEKALSESEERYRTRFNALIEGFCVIEMVFDPAGKPVDYRFLEINPAFEAQTGLRNATGKLMRDLAPDHEQPWFDIYGKVAVTGEPVHFENEAAALGRWYEVRAFRVGGEESRKVAICFNDVTERKNAEAEKSNLASIVENSDDAIIGKTPDGIITTWNAGAEKIYGYSAAEVIGRSVSILIPPDKTDDI